MSNKALSQQVGQTAGAAAGTAIAPIIGTAIGGAVGNIIGGIFGGGTAAEPGKTQWQNAPAEVRDLWSHTRRQPFEQAFLSWMQQNHPDKFLNADTVKGLRYVWAFTGPDAGGINNLNNPEYMLAPDKARALWSSMGVDIDATLANVTAKGGNVNNIPARDVTRTSPSPQAVDELQRIKNKADNGQPLTPAEQQALAALKRGASTGEGLDLGTVFLLVGAAVAIYFATR